MIKTQIIQEGNKPIAVILDYAEYQKLREVAEDKSDYISAVKTKKSNRKWIDNGILKKELGL